MACRKDLCVEWRLRYIGAESVCLVARGKRTGMPTTYQNPPGFEDRHIGAIRPVINTIVHVIYGFHQTGSNLRNGCPPKFEMSALHGVAGKHKN